MFLSVSYNKLIGSIPTSLGNLSYLNLLNFGSNSLSGSIPYELGQLVSLEALQISLNELSGEIPLSLFNLSSLTSFAAIKNNLQGSLPADLGLTLPNLKLFMVSSNFLSGHVPASVSNLSSLGMLDLGNNSFSGAIPPNLGRLQGLVNFRLYNNKLENRDGDELSFLRELTNCTRLEQLNVWRNHLVGLLPNSISNLSSNLRQLSLGDNRIHGNLPRGIENLENLEILTLPNMFLTGEIPDSIGKLNRLQVLALKQNKLSGVLPSSIGNITSLNLLYLNENGLTGSIPLSLGNFGFLQELNLSQNKLTGPIPKQVFSLSSLTRFLDLSHNSLSGLLPMEVGNLKNLGELNISNNQLSGEMPSTLSNCLSLEHLIIHANLFNGTIPSSLRTLRGIVRLDLSSNNLSGEIPKYLSDFTFLSYLNLSFNNLEGKVPEVGIFKNKAAVSVIGNDKLCGGIKELELPACPTHTLGQQRRDKHHLKQVLIISGAIICLLLIFILALYYYWRRISNRISCRHPSSSEDKFFALSYRDLFKATNGFSCDNLIGEGSYGSVYKGVLENNERVVAVKVLNLQKRGASQSFMAECEALRSIRHRNLVKIITACSSIDSKGNDFKALVFTYLPNGSLEKWLHPKSSEGPSQMRNLTFKERLNIAIDVALALEYLHHHCEVPIVHRDLKPGNVLLDNDMNAYVGDFGIARFLHEATGNQTTSAVKGTTGYIAPEYGMNAKVSTQGDVYSYGILLLEMFTRKKPTEEMFADGLSLHQFVKTALPQQLTEIVDPLLLLEDGEVVRNGRSRNGGINWQNCLLSVLRIGLSCSEELPSRRLEMNSVVSEMYLFRDMYSGIGIYRNRQNMTDT
ncbi:probable LRR receptor-like serine/threonine-protein kinase At3g47570 [Aristolochia californica]|uniref:probable LRR receptor-like serine/threonine-protein kinase At3g47570 n=1 Tax=Aristolochia californica TaxID=171875 RepID=UPI0035DDDBA9